MRRLGTDEYRLINLRLWNPVVEEADHYVRPPSSESDFKDCCKD